MSKNEEIRRALKLMFSNSSIVIGEVKGINMNKFTVDIDPLDGGALIFDVKIKPDSSNTNDEFCLIPEIGSTVLIGSIEGDSNNLIILMYSKVDKVFLRGGAYGGLIKIQEFKQQYDVAFNTLKAAISAGFTALSAIDSGASATAFNSAVAALQPLNLQLIENNKVVHG
jgi:hypothetical protein